MSESRIFRNLSRPLLIALSFGMLLSSPRAFAAQTAQKIGVVDYGRIFQMMPETKTADETLQALRNQTNAELATQQAAIQKAIQAYQKTGKKNPAKENELRAQDEKFRKNVSDKQRMLSQKEQELVTPIRQKIDATVSSVAQKDGYSMILDKNVRVYGDEQSDITYKVLDQLNIR